MTSLLSLADAPLLWAALTFVPAASAAPMILPPPVDEAAFAARLFEMTSPSAGERAVILYDPTYYGGITDRLREQLHQRGVFTYVLVEETPTMVDAYRDDDAAHERQEKEVVDSLLPLFQRSDIFYWMPVRGYGNDLRWERLVERSRVRSVHFHWMIPFPGDGDSERIERESRASERRCLEVDFVEHARRQERLAAALKGRTLRITTPGGTDLRLSVASDQWFHLGNGDASRARAATARSIRDREIELPVGMFHFLPNAENVDGVLASPTVRRTDGAVRDARLTLSRGRVTRVAAAEGEEAIRKAMAGIGEDGNKIATVWMNTNPHNERFGINVELGSNWENGGRNRADGARRLSVPLVDATLEADGRVLMRDGRILWEAIP
jgi:hypothetical protein